MVFVDILASHVSDKTLKFYQEGLSDGGERVVSGTAWALSSSNNFNANSLYLTVEVLSFDQFVFRRQVERVGIIQGFQHAVDGSFNKQFLIDWLAEILTLHRFDLSPKWLESFCCISIGK